MVLPSAVGDSSNNGRMDSIRGSSIGSSIAITESSDVNRDGVVSINANSIGENHSLADGHQGEKGNDELKKSKNKGIRTVFRKELGWNRL